jgi:hypothetical protein
MAINRSLMERQLRMGGGIMGLESRQQYGLGSFVKKAVKGVTGAVKKIAKSDLGKAALLAAGAYYAPAMFGGTVGFGPASTYGSFARGLMSPGLIGPMTKAGSLGRGISSAVTGNAGMIGATVLGGVLGSMTPQEQEEVSGGRNVEALRSKLTKTYTDLQYDPAKIPDLVANDLSEYTSGQGGYAEGGRIGYGDGTPYVEPDPAMMVDTTTFNPIPEDADRQQAAEIVKIMMATRGLPREEGEIEDTETMSTEDFMLNEYFKPKREELMENFGLSLEEANNLIREEAIKIRGNNANGGRMGYAFGTPEQNAIQAAGIEGLPLNQNPAGVTELDLRDSGGFIPPVGVKEKADDIPAMLANNEFVFTADAVRGMGEGNVNKGAQRMYDMMKKLEKGGRV